MVIETDVSYLMILVWALFAPAAAAGRSVILKEIEQEMTQRLLKSLRLAPRHARRPWQMRVTLWHSGRAIVYKQQNCVPPWVKKYFETYNYLCECLSSYALLLVHFQFLAPESR